MTKYMSEFCFLYFPYHVNVDLQTGLNSVSLSGLVVEFPSRSLIVILVQATGTQIDGQEEVDHHDDDHSNTDSPDNLNMTADLLLDLGEASLDEDSVSECGNHLEMVGYLTAISDLREARDS